MRTTRGVLRGILALAAAVCLGGSGTIAMAAVQTFERTLDFEDFPALAVSPILAGYGSFTDGSFHWAGFVWSAPQGMFATDWHVSEPDGQGVPGYKAGTHSGVHTAVNGFGGAPFEIHSVSGLFKVDHFFLTSAEGLQSVTMQGLRGDNLVAGLSTTIQIDRFGPHQVTLDWSGIDTLRFNVPQPTPSPAFPQTVLDDFTYTVSVPEPRAELYVASGLLLLAACIYLRRQRMERVRIG